ncbi:MAG: ECF transporter S component [Atribacterota bacterium]|nr:ECF transporter S component [Atribacterota bacterium]MDD4288690.1 ECF transporter S component [Atribacterota bacterium]
MQQTRIRWISRTAILLAIALVFQMGGFPQFITGPLVNTVLYLATMIVGWQGGILIGIFTPVIAAMRGILPPPLAPLIPFIALGNAILVILFFWLKSKNKIFGIIIASLVKFLVLVSAVRLLVQVPPAIAQMMSFPQLVTALAGGFFALIIINIFKRAKINIR